MNALVTIPANNVEHYRTSTEAAHLCKEIVVASALEIQDRKYVRVEGWQAIAIAHGCTASARDVERVEGGVRAIGEVRRMTDGAVIAEAEGFVGEDEPTWYGGTVHAWKWGRERGQKVWYDKELPKRPDYAIRAMAQTRAISRACRSAFAHVVVMMNAGLSTTPAEEVGWDNDHEAAQEVAETVRDVTPKDPPTPPEESGLYIACKAAIDLAEDRPALNKWSADNEASLAKIKADEPAIYDAVLAYWKRRLKELSKATARPEVAADKASEPAPPPLEERPISSRAQPQHAPADDFGLGDDEVPF